MVKEYSRVPGMSHEQFFQQCYTKTKWQRLRNNFSKAIEKRAKTPRSGSAATKLQKPWIYEADIEFLRFHLQHHRASSSSLLRESPVADVELNPLSPQLDVSDNPENSLDIAPRSHSSPPRSTPPVQQGSLNSAARPKAKKRDANDLDSAVLSYINRTRARDGEPEDPAIGWFKSLLPIPSEGEISNGQQGITEANHKLPTISIWLWRQPSDRRRRPPP
ncbi:hypothetical protein RRG08_034686 [Elysia crispata]|uniref:Uncharacterized protein n=1 Tax=Elysia crispata TaxID=231223 RepID=A0AAE1D8Z7_9GAST|nr:hypothetical protein RRG08_034686 [Elysia crispata]